jgi:hypothetical protein
MIVYLINKRIDYLRKNLDDTDSSNIFEKSLDILNSVKNYFIREPFISVDNSSYIILEWRSDTNFIFSTLHEKLTLTIADKTGITSIRLSDNAYFIDKLCKYNLAVAKE